MKLEKNTKSSDYIHYTVHSKMKLLQPSEIHTENINFPLKSHVIKTIFLQ